MSDVPYGHLGAWTMAVPALTRDELHNDVVAVAQEVGGFKLDGAELRRLEDYRKELYGSPVLGAGRIRDAAHAGDLAHLARRALDRLNEGTPAGRRFVLTDALYLVDSD